MEAIVMSPYVFPIPFYLHVPPQSDLSFKTKQNKKPLHLPAKRVMYVNITSEIKTSICLGLGSRVLSVTLPTVVCTNLGP